MPQCNKCVFKNCRGLFGRALARCTVTKCARPCLCKKKCLSVCLKCRLLQNGSSRKVQHRKKLEFLLLVLFF